MHRGRMFRGMIAVVGLLVLACVFPLVASAADPVNTPDPRYVITRLGDQTPVVAPPRPMAAAQVQSFHFSAQGKITAAGQPDELRLSMQGEFAMPDRFHANLTLSDGTKSPPVALEFVVIGEKPYIHLPKDLAPGGKDVWVLVDDLSTLGTIPGANIPSLANLPPVPTQTQTLGDETINGVPTTHTRTTIDATALLGGTAKGTKPSMLTLDLWTGKADDFPRRLAINGNVSINPETLLGGSGATSSTADNVNLSLTFTMDFTDINAPVTITAPATYVKLSELLK